MNLVGVLESLAADTWERLRDAQHLGVRFGEETVTDLVLLELKRTRHPGLQVLQTNKHAESTQGTDWEWWLGSDSQGWLRFAVQAKRLCVSTGRYLALAHKTRGEQQIDLLERFASDNGAVPLYCLFNFTEKAGPPSWHCCEALTPPQLGCTLAPAAVIRHAIESHGHRTFRSIHANPRTLPWRCLAKCSKFRPVASPTDGSFSVGERLIELFGDGVTLYSRLPAAILRARARGVIDEPAELYAADAAQVPSRVVILDFDLEETV
jgi:hypothetical protein